MNPAALASIQYDATTPIFISPSLTVAEWHTVTMAGKCEHNGRCGGACHGNNRNEAWKPGAHRSPTPTIRPSVPGCPRPGLFRRRAILRTCDQPLRTGAAETMNTNARNQSDIWLSSRLSRRGGSIPVVPSPAALPTSRGRAGRSRCAACRCRAPRHRRGRH